MIFDFISGEAGTQEGGDKFAKWLAEDTDLTQKEKKSVIEKIKDFFTKRLDSTPEHTVRDEYAQEVLDTLRGMAITLSDEQKAETAYHHDRYGNDLLFLYFASKSTAISTITPKDFCFSCFLCKRKFGLTKPKIKSKIKKGQPKSCPYGRGDKNIGTKFGFAAGFLPYCTATVLQRRYCPQGSASLFLSPGSIFLRSIRGKLLHIGVCRLCVLILIIGEHIAVGV